ncbi:MAG TPA: MaoC family dehydratase N-terminal domain-containing protein [Actinomycetaceae bacterium]|nr:MaoC family dehydratase N-terminal domain-containing protein [Actinomycetaceae bacterium]
MTNSEPTGGVNDALVGSSYPPEGVFRVGAEHIAQFSAATGATSPIHFDRAAAQDAGYDDVVAPPTFAVVVAQRAEAAYVRDPESGIDFSRVVHGEEHFTHHRPIVAGDELVTTVHVESVVHRGALDMVTTRAEIADAAATPVATVTSTLVVRGADS